MPRKGRGGQRQGTPGTAYSNRTDLNMPVSTVPNQEYGAAAKQQAAQKAVPMASSPNVQAPTPARASTPIPAPGTMPHLDPTNRPNEPVTAGMPFGAGAGPEAIEPNYPNLAQIIQNTAQGKFSSMATLQLANVARSLGY